VQKAAHSPGHGKYQVLKHLASGGMAEVHLARSTGIGGFERYVVLKKILGDHAKDPRFVAMFLDEARLAAQLHHQNIAQVYDIGEEDGTYFFAMEYVHGEDVRALLRKVEVLKRQVPTEHALSIVAGAAAGLHYAHEKRGADRAPLGLVHRDVSPSNVLVAYDGAVKLVDFGIAKAATRSSETKSGTLKGKVAYMSPEQCLGKTLDRRSDVFSLGVVMYEILTLMRLFKYENDYVTMNRIVEGVVAPPSTVRPDLPAGLEPIVMRCLEKDPVARYQTAGELLEALEGYAVEQKVVMSPQGLGRYVKELFGERPEPWLELEKEAERERHVSYMDGTDAGLSLTVTDSFVGPPAKGPAPGLRAPTKETVPDVEAPSGARKKGRNRRAWLVAAGLVIASAAAGGVVAMTSEDPEPEPSTSTTTPTPTSPEPTTTAPVAPVDTATTSAPVDTSAATTVAPVETGAAPDETTGARTTVEKKKRKKKEPKVEAKVEVNEAPKVEVKPPERDTSILIRPSQKKEKP
jgi:serine/threonine protein kinase